MAESIKFPIYANVQYKSEGIPNSDATYYERRMLAKKNLQEDFSADEHLVQPYWFAKGTTYNSHVWLCEFSASHKKTINFCIELEDGSKLTDVENGELLNAFKLFIMVQFHPRFNGGVRYSPQTAYSRMKEALHILDWLLLNQRNFNIKKCLLECITKNDFSLYLRDCGVKGVWVATYDFYRSLTRWLKVKITTIDEAEFKLILSRFPNIVNMPCKDERVLDLTDEELILSRAYFIIEKSYKFVYGEFCIVTGKFVREFYKNTLHGPYITPEIPPDFRLGENYGREYNSVDVRNVESDGYSRAVVKKKLSALKRFVVVDAFYIGTGINHRSISGLNVRTLVGDDGRSVGRYLSLPTNAVLNIMRQVMEYGLEYGKSVLDATFEFLSRNLDKAENCFFGPRTIQYLNGTEKIVYRGEELSIWTSTSIGRDASFFSRVRSEPGLHDLYRIFIGSLQVVLGSLMARRQSEIADLLNDECLVPFVNPFLPENSTVEYFLKFGVRKSGHAGVLRIVERPLPRVAAKLVWLMIEFNDKCTRKGFRSSEGSLLSTICPQELRVSSITANLYNSYLDTLSDFFETPVVENGNGLVERYYVRQHQLRRFFATVFFWSNGFDGLDVLRYMLGHIDLEDLYHYISESTPGDTLNGVKSERIAYCLLNGNSEVIENLEMIREMLCKQLQVSIMSVKTFDQIYDDYSYQVDEGLILTNQPLDSFRRSIELEKDIYELLDKGVVELQPEFFRVKSPTGYTTDFSLVIKVGENV